MPWKMWAEPVKGVPLGVSSVIVTVVRRYPLIKAHLSQK